MPRKSIRRLRSISHYHQAPGRQPRPRSIKPNEELLELVTGGRGWFLTGGQWIEVTSGALLWHVPGDETIGRSDFENPYRCLAVQFDTIGRPKRPVPRHTLWPEPDEVLHFAREVLRASLDEDFDRDVLGAYVLGRLHFQALAHQRNLTPGDLPAGLQRACRLIERDFAKPLTLRDLAAAAGWSQAHLHVVARQHLGTSPHQLLLQRRLRAARERLAASRDPVKQIAVECGFNSAPAFCHIFREHLGTTPAAYREAQWRIFSEVPEKPAG